MDVPKTLDCTSIEEKDLVSRYVGQKLSPEEAEAFEEHYFGCDRCWAEVQRGTEVKAALGSPALAVAIDSKRVIRGPWKTVGLLAAAAALALVAAGVLLKPRGNSTNDLILASEQLTSRPIAARLTDPFPYRPLERAYRGPTEDTLPLDVRRAALDAQKRAQEDPTPSSLRAAGVAHLLMGEFDDAIANLEKAKAAASDDTGLLNDLAAAYYSRAQHRDRVGQRDDALGDLNEALKLIRVALEKNPSLAQAAFNRALILESQQFREQAVEAWRRYLEIDPGSKWSEEARSHLSRLRTAADNSLWDRGRKELEQAAASGRSEVVDVLVARYSQQSRLYVEDEILPAWGTAFQLGSTEAPKFLRISREVGASLARRSKDSLVSEAVAQLDEVVTASGSPAAARPLAEAYQLYGEGRSLFKAHEIEKAVKLLARAEDLLAGAGSIFAAQVRIVLASSRFYQSDLDGCGALLSRIEQQLGDRSTSYGSVIAQLHWLRGLIELTRGHAEESLQSYRVTLETFRGLNELENVAAAHTLIAENLQYLGAVDEALGHRTEALAILNSIPGSPRLHTTLREIADGAYSRGRYEIARVAHEQLLTISARQGSPTFMTDSLLLLSLTQAKTDDVSTARRTVARARDFCSTIDEKAVRERTEADLDSVEARLFEQSDPKKAIALLSRAIGYFVRVSNHSRLAQVYLDRGLLFAATGDEATAERDLLAGADELEAERGRIADDQFRLSYFESGKDVFDELVAVIARKGDQELSLTVAEKAKARALLERAVFQRAAGSPTAGSRTTASPLDARAIASRLPDAMAVIEYRVLPDRVLVWVVARHEVGLTTVSISGAAIADQVADFARSVHKPRGPADRESSAELYKELIQPIESRLGGIETLVFVADKILFEVPFAAIRNPSDGRYLIQHYRICAAPSASLFIAALDRAGSSSQPFRSALVVENPSFDRTRFPGLSPLLQATEETSQLRTVLETVELQTAAAATRHRFLERAPKFDLVHFAGHAIVSRDPAFSMLLFAHDSKGGEPAFLYAHEIEKTHFGRTRLVVLAACETAQGRVNEVEGVMSLGRAFLAAGAGSVLATLWAVDDAATAVFFEDFYRHLASGDDAVRALQAAQLTMLHSGNPAFRDPAAWAPFVMIGWV